MLIDHPTGGYRFLPGIEPYSSGVIASAGREIVHATLARPLPWRDGFARLDAHLRALGRPRAALCGVELRCPRPFTRPGFIDFNRGYRALLDEWGILTDGQNPVARTHVAPSHLPPSEVTLYAFSYTMPAATDAPPTFVVAGGGEFRGGPLLEAEVVRDGETSPDAMREKAHHVMGLMARRLAGLGVGWDDVTTTDIYSVQGIDALIGPEVLDVIGAAAAHAVRWHHARPPIDVLEYEMDLRGVRTEIVI